MNMDDLLKKAIYMRGYKDALPENMTTEDCAKLISKLIDLVTAMSEEISDLKERVLDLELDLDDDYDDDDLFADDDDDDDLFDDDDDYDDDNDDDLFELQCVECGEDFLISYDDIMSDKPIKCPHCNADIELEIEPDDDDEDENDFGDYSKEL